MTADPREALGALVAALQRHLEAAADRQGEDDPVVIAAYDDVADAFEDYDEALMEAFGEVTPLEVFSDDEDDLDDESEEDEEFAYDEDDDEDDDHYFGLDDEDLEEDTREGADADSGAAPGSADRSGS